MIKLGNKVRDSLTGFEGIAIGRTEWMYGCTRIGIDPVGLHDGKPIDTQWFDEQRVELVEDAEPAVSKESKAEFRLDDGPSPRRMTGGPQADPSRSSGLP